MQSTSEVPKYQARYARVASEESNRIVDLQKWEKGRALHENLLEQSHRIAQKLETVKIHHAGLGWHYVERFKAYDKSADLTLCGLNTQSVLKLPGFRNISAIPYQARKNRKKVMAELEYFLNGVVAPRTWVHTTGVRCSIEEATARFKKVHREISKINYEKFMKDAGAEFVFRSGELGEIVKTDDGLSVHPHVHSVLVLDQQLPKREWSHLLTRIRSYFGSYSHDCGVIRDVRELVKYVCKPSDLEDLNGYDLLKINNLCKSVRMVETLRSFRKLRRDIRESNEQVRRVRGTLKRERKWKEKNASELPRWLTHKEVTGGPATEPSVVSWCAPSAVFTPVTEPCFIVHGLGDCEPSNIFAWPEVQSMRRAIRVHTKALTVRREKEKIREIGKMYNESKQKIPPKPPSVVKI